MFNDENECGTGAVVPWAGKLWAITYGPHCPFGSSDLLYEISPDLYPSHLNFSVAPASNTPFPEGKRGMEWKKSNVGSITRVIRPESIGGTSAARMIHTESNQLFLGPYAIAADGDVRVIRTDVMPGRLTGFARSPSDPAKKILCATMEEGIYEIDVQTLDVTELWPDTNLPGNEAKAPNRTVRPMPGAGDDILPGYHGKGFYSGQGRLIYANNGENSPEARVDPMTVSGALGEWFDPEAVGVKQADAENPQANPWRTILRRQFCDVTGPGGIYGNANAASDPVWSIGWDHRSLIFMLLDKGVWHRFRLPKGSRSYDGAHGWNTEWPRIRSIARSDQACSDENLLMTMHGVFWDFPKNFSAQNASGIRPKSAYLKVIGDFARWDDFDAGRWLVLGCDDTAGSEFLNRRKYKGDLAAPGRSQSNLWFVAPETLNRLGPVFASGAVWESEPVAADTSSDPFLFAGWPKRSLYVDCGDRKPRTLRLEIDRDGTGCWEPLLTTELADGTAWLAFDEQQTGEWVRLTLDQDAPNVTAVFHFLPNDERGTDPDQKFDTLATLESDSFCGGLLWADAEGNLQFAADFLRPIPSAGFRLDSTLAATRLNGDEEKALRQKAAFSRCNPEYDADAVRIHDDAGRSFRLPVAWRRGDFSAIQRFESIPVRHDREICTERDLFHVGGTFFELPAENAGGFFGIRPIASHRFWITDYASWRGLLVLTGIDLSAAQSRPNPHRIATGENGEALWLGVADDLWSLGKPTGRVTVWDSATPAAAPSDPCLANGYEKKRLILHLDDSVDSVHSAAEGADTAVRGAGNSTGSRVAPKAVRVRLEADFTGRGEFHPVRTFELSPGETLDETLDAAFGAFWLRLVPESAAALSAEFRYNE